jgi:uncharacterized protein with WD repeat
VQHIYFSPRSTYLVCWKRPENKKKKAEASLEKIDNCDLLSSSGESFVSNKGNLSIWRVSNGEEVASFSQKLLRMNVIQWCDDERCCMRLVNNEIHIYNDSFIVIEKIYQTGLTQFKMSPSYPPHVAVFTPEAKGNAARIFLYSTSLNADGLLSVSDASILTRTLFSASEVSLLWVILS